MSAWADINVVFGGGWQPSEMHSMSYDELISWYNQAVEKNKQMNAD